MALYFTVSDLREIRSCYAVLGITNSGVLDQVKCAITSMHFGDEDIEEIIEIADTVSKMNPATVSVGLQQAINHAEIIKNCHIKAKQHSGAKVVTA